MNNLITSVLVSRKQVILFLVFLFSMAFFSYEFNRTQSVSLTLILIGFVVYFWMGTDKINFNLLLCLFIISRLVLLFPFPNLSEDYLRFIWDGNLILDGENPYRYTPENWLRMHSDNSFYQELVSMNLGWSNGINSPAYFSVYPPVNQSFFALAAWLGRQNIYANVFFLRIIVVLFELGLIFEIKKYLTNKGFALKPLFWIFFNPLLILESTVNLHFEVVTLFFLLKAINQFEMRRLSSAGLFLALSVGVKLLPLISLPIFISAIFRDNWKSVGNRIRKILIAGLKFLFPFFLFIGLMLMVPHIDKMFVSAKLYFEVFEFNAGIFYWVREIGFYIKGYDIIGIYSSFSAAIVALAVCILAFYKFSHEKLMQSILWSVTIYYLMASIVHPWYILNILVIGMLIGRVFPLIWSVLIVTSYFAYSTFGVQENLLMVGLQYLILFAVIAIEVFGNKKIKGLIEGFILPTTDGNR